MAKDVHALRLNDPADAARWDELVATLSSADVYHRAAYVLASAELEHTEPIGLVISTNGCRYLVPILLRSIAGPANRYWTDASTPYGYGGVLRLNIESAVAPQELAVLFLNLRAWCAENELVSCVLRSHPLLAQAWLFAEPVGIDFVMITRRGQTVSLSLQRWDSILGRVPGLSKGRRSDLALSRRKLRVTWNSRADRRSTLEQLRIFQSLYNRTMHRVDADEFFLFPFSYYERLSELSEDLGVAIAWCEDHPAGAALFMAGPKYSHYHLSATDDMGRKYKAATLLVVEGARWAHERGCKSLHLGGGMRHNDSLMAFKQSFGGCLHEYGCVIVIADTQRFYEMRSLPDSPWPYDQ